MWNIIHALSMNMNIANFIETLDVTDGDDDATADVGAAFVTTSQYFLSFLINDETSNICIRRGIIVSV